MKMVIGLAPLILLELVLLVVALVDLAKRPKVTGGNKVIWLIVILFIGTIGPIIYLIFGRRESE
ncbi:MAG: PLD nuclease N-terminal domain-containing protein [Actinomycetota bacterium]|nr:PLD nuclease N-terminal domain-containing protein [Actinomycetota bacterium]